MGSVLSAAHRARVVVVIVHQAAGSVADPLRNDICTLYSLVSSTALYIMYY